MLTRSSARPGLAWVPFAAVAILFALATTAALGARVPQPTDPATIVRVENAGLRIGVDPNRGELVEFVDLASARNFAPVDPAQRGLWEVELGGLPAVTVSPADSRAVQFEELGGGRSGWRLTWKKLGIPDLPDLRIEVTAELDPREPMSRWGLAVAGTAGRTPARIRFPRLRDLPRMEREHLAMPFWAGLLAPDPRRVLGGANRGAGRREVDYPGHSSLQCLAYYSGDGPGLYAACDDTAGHRKLFAALTTDRGDLGLEMTHLPERDPAGPDRVALPYSVVLGTFRGDWYDAAALYRGWATNQAWAREARWKRGQVPSWIADTGLWIWNRGRSPGVLDPALALREEAGLPVSVFWHWWHGCAYDTGFPEYLPPREGAEAFTAALARAQARDVHALVYMNQRLWGMSTASWTNESAATYAVKSADGRVIPEVYNTFTRLPCASMCLGTEFWRRKYAGIAETAVRELGVDGIYMDQACSSLACYDPRHGHPPGGGTYWMKGFQALAADLRQRGGPRGAPALAGEGCAENWLPHLDVMLALDVSRERYAGPDGWEPIPLFHAVYHGYGVFYGSYSSLTMPPYDDLWPAVTAPKEPLRLLDPKFRRQFCLEQARAFCWGQQPTLANFQPRHLQERPEEMAFVLRLARQRRASLKYLQDGTLLPPPVVVVPREEIPMSRLSIYAGQQGGLKEFTQTVPLVLASAWRAPDGSVAIAVASIADQPLSPAFILDPARCGLPAEVQMTAPGSTGSPPDLERREGKLVLRASLAPRDVRVWELRAK